MDQAEAKIEAPPHPLDVPACLRRVGWEASANAQIAPNPPRQGDAAARWLAKHDVKTARS
jgi:hypothetical protein